MAAYLPLGLPEPVVIALLREAQLDSGINPAMIYDRTLYIMASLLIIGLVCNSLVRSVNGSLHMSTEELAHVRMLQRDNVISANAKTAARGSVVAVLAWIAVGIPFLIALYTALAKAAALF